MPRVGHYCAVVGYLWPGVDALHVEEGFEAFDYFQERGSCERLYELTAPSRCKARSGIGGGVDHVNVVVQWL